jgi:hypothetical protein
MANIVTSRVKVKANSQTLDKLHELLDQVNGSSEDAITALARTFYESVDVTEHNEVLISWAMDNFGSKWVILTDICDDGEFNMESAYYPPSDFFKRLYDLLSPLDESLIIEVTYIEEFYSPVGVYLIRKDEDGISFIHQHEDMVNPTDEMDSDDDTYDDVLQKFYEDVFFKQEELLDMCYKL